MFLSHTGGILPLGRYSLFTATGSPIVRHYVGLETLASHRNHPRISLTPIDASYLVVTWFKVRKLVVTFTIADDAQADLGKTRLLSGENLIKAHQHTGNGLTVIVQ